MRLSTGLLIGGLVLVVAPLGACTQQLGAPTGLAGRGGASGHAGVTGAGDAIGGAIATRGAGGIPGWTTSDAAVDGPDAASCDSFVTQYAAALKDAQSCSPGAVGQCQHMISAHLSDCDSCPTYVNDPTELLSISTAWQRAGCAVMPAGQTCGQGPCMTPTNNTCSDLGNGTGLCAFGTSAGTGGSAAAAPGGG